MIILEHLHIENIGSYALADFNLRNQGFVLMTGNNKDTKGSNGSGKSTPWEALRELFYGKTSRGFKGADLVNRLGSDGSYISIQYEAQSLPWVASKGTGHSVHGNVFELLKDGVSCRENKRETRQLAADSIGFTASEFDSLVFLNQYMVHLMLGGNAGERRTFLSELFGINVAAWFEEVKRRSLAIDPLVEKLTQHQQARQSILDQLQGRSSLQLQERLPSLQEAAAAADKEHQDANFQLLGYEAHVKLQTTLARLGLTPEELRDCNSLLARLQVRKAQVETELLDLSAQKQRVTDYEQALKRLSTPVIIPPLKDGDHEELQSQIDELQAEKDAISPTLSLLKQRQDRQVELSRLANAQPLADSELAYQEAMNLVASSSSTKNTYEHLGTALEHVHGDHAQECPICSSALGEEKLAIAKGRIQEKVQEADFMLSLVEPSIPELIKVLTDARKKQECEQALQQLPEGSHAQATARLTQISQRIAALKYSQKEAMDSAKAVQVAEEQERARQESLSRLSVPEHTLVELRQISGVLSAERDTLNQQIQRLQEARPFLALLSQHPVDPIEKDAVTSLDQKRKRASQALQQLELEIAQVKQLEERLTQMKDKTTELEEATNRQWVLSVLHSAFSNRGGFRQYQLRHVMQELMQVLPQYFAFMFPEAMTAIRLEPSEDSIDLVYERQGQTIPLLNGSGGESQRTNLALLHSVAHMAGVSKRSNVLILDEPFRFLDDVGVQNYMTLLAHLADQKIYETIIVTAQSDSIPPQQFDHVWLAVMEKGISRLEVLS